MKSLLFVCLSLSSLLLSACERPQSLNAQPHSQPHSQPHKSAPSTSAQAAPLNPTGQGARVAIFAGGCFWCMEAALQPLKGVKAVISGYTGGSEPAPTYQEVSMGATTHLEAVWVEFDPSVTSYEALLEAFWRNIDPTQADGQFADRGSQYRTAIFYLSAEQKTLAESSRDTLAKSERFTAPLVTTLRRAELFWPAEDYHQDYYLKNAAHYARYKEGSGRGPFLRRVWGETPHP